jgi:hypothetical protein
LSRLAQILIERLEKKGIEPTVMPGFIRDLANSILVNPRMNVLQVNKRLHHLGWDGFDLDEHTLQLAIACFEAKGLKSIGNKPPSWFKDNFKPHNSGATG